MPSNFTTIAVKRKTKELLVRIKGMMIIQKGRNVDMDTVIVELARMYFGGKNIGKKEEEQNC